MSNRCPHGLSNRCITHRHASARPRPHPIIAVSIVNSRPPRSYPVAAKDMNCDSVTLRSGLYLPRSAALASMAGTSAPSPSAPPRPRTCSSRPSGVRPEDSHCGGGSRGWWRAQEQFVRAGRQSQRRTVMQRSFMLRSPPTPTRAVPNRGAPTGCPTPLHSKWKLAWPGAQKARQRCATRQVPVHTAGCRQAAARMPPLRLPTSGRCYVPRTATLPSICNR